MKSFQDIFYFKFTQKLVADEQSVSSTDNFFFKTDWMNKS